MSIWDDLDKEASVDNRIGNHDFIVDKITPGVWPDGQEYYELEGRLTTANNFNLKQRLSPAPTEEEVLKNKSSWDQARKRSAVLAHANDTVLAEHYSTTLAGISPGSTFRVKTDYQTKDGKKYIRLISFLPKTAALSANGTNSSNIPF
jgi:hypothetical protein